MPVVIIRRRKVVSPLKKRYLIFYTLLRPLVILFLKLRFRFRYEKAKELPEKYIVLSNHATDYDMLLVAASFPRQMYFVGSEHIARWKIYPLLQYAFAPIIRYKGAPATATIMEMLRKVRQGANVCMFAEGVRTWDGVTCPILPATAKLIKTAGCGLVTYKLTGGYFASPMWCGAKVRRGPVHGAPVRVFTPEQLKEMTAEEVYAAITHDLYEDAYARQLADPKPYRGKNLAKGMENLLFRCPDCGGIDCFTSQGDTVSCRECGLTLHYDAFGFLTGSHFRTVKELSDWQKEQVLRDVSEGKEYTAGDCVLRTVHKHEETFLGKGSIRMGPDTLRCAGMTFSMEEIADLSMHGQRAIVFTVKGTYYELIPGDGANVLKFMLYFNGCKENQKVKAG